MQTEGAEADALLPTMAPSPAGGGISIIEVLAAIPEEEVWLAKQKSKRTRRAYKQEVAHFMRTLKIRSYEERRQVDHRAVIASQAPNLPGGARS